MELERRRHNRLPLKLSIFCQKVGQSGERLISGRTLNVSPGGMLVEMKGAEINDGELLSVEMSVPPSEDLLDYGGNFSIYARVIRTISQETSEDSSSKQFALEFCDSPTLRF
jgi:c-di-GMP-binding flagellar brake protein YcgR